MRVFPLAVLVVLVAGCGSPDVGPTTTLSPGEHFLVDAVDPGLDAVYDLLSGDFRELNGSVVLELGFRDVYSPVPRLLAVFSVEANESSHSYFARSVADSTKAAPYVRWEMGRLEGGRMEPMGEICTYHRATNEPHVSMLDLPNNWTDLEGGGRITALHVDVGSFEDNATLDTGDSHRTVTLRGGRNPYTTCPLIAERPE
jgi:hypothetical protein